MTLNLRVHWRTGRTRQIRVVDYGMRGLDSLIVGTPLQELALAVGEGAGD